MFGFVKKRAVPWGRFSLLVLVIALVGLSSCTPSRFVKPLEKGEMAVSGTLGGSIFKNFGAPIPLPFSTLAFGYGIKDDLTAFAGIHTTAMAFGVIQMDLGVTKSFLEPDGARPGISVSPVLNFAVDVWEGNFKFWPQVDVNAWWEYGEKKHYAYFGIGNWLELAGEKAHGEKQTVHYIPGLQAGNTFRRAKWDYTVEMKYNAPLVANEGVTIDFVSPGRHGGIGVYLGISRRF